MSVTLVWMWNIYTHVEDSGGCKGAKPPPAPFLSVRLYYWTPVKTSNTAKYGKECNFATSVWYSKAKKFRIQGAVSPWLPLQARGPRLPSGLPSFIAGSSAAGCVVCISDTEAGQREWDNTSSGPKFTILVSPDLVTLRSPCCRQHGMLQCEVKWWRFVALLQ